LLLNFEHAIEFITKHKQGEDYNVAGKAYVNYSGEEAEELAGRRAGALPRWMQ
jgi:hypothetical protein